MIANEIADIVLLDEDWYTQIYQMDRFHITDKPFVRIFPHSTKFLGFSERKSSNLYFSKKTHLGSTCQSIKIRETF